YNLTTKMAAIKSKQMHDPFSNSAPGAEPLASDTTDLLSNRAEIFRSKLIEDFHLLDSINDKGHLEAPKYYSNEISEDSTAMNKMLKEGPHSLVKFIVYNTKDKVGLTQSDRRANRVKNKNARIIRPEIFAHRILQTTMFRNMMLVLILLNSVILGIQAEVKDLASEGAIGTFKLMMNIIDYVTLFVFVIEIVLKWIDDFWDFWKSGWNIFDFIVTFLSFLPEIIKFSKTPGSDTDGIAVIAENLRVFRILRSLKMVNRFRQVRLIALAVAKAFQAMASITILLLTFAYIFAIGGVIFFDQYTHSNRDDLEYKQSFSTIPHCLITLFQLLTLDHWYDIMSDITKVADPAFSAFYIIVWICIGSFIFRNIFVGIMVNNFQSIRNDLVQEVKELENVKQDVMKMEKFNEVLNKQADRRQSNTISGHVLDIRQSSMLQLQPMPYSSISLGLPGMNVIPTEQSRHSMTINDRAALMLQSSQHLNVAPSGVIDIDTNELTRAVSEQVIQEAQDGMTWQEVVEDNMTTIAKKTAPTIWPRDTLFRYFLLMEALQENLQERSLMLDILSKSIASFHDT
ncbi:unnamed protein product, partial [Owenia fusiformis]